MPKASPSQNVFEGEFSPLAEGRTDLDRYPHAMRYMSNMVGCRTGPAIGRSGTMYEQKTAFKNQKSILVPFVFNEDETLQIEFANNRLRFHYEYNGIAAHRETAATAVVANNNLTLTLPGHDHAVGEYAIFSGFDGARRVNNRIALITGVAGDNVTYSITADGALGALSGDEEVSIVYEVASPYSHEDVENIRYAQNLNTVYLWCKKTDGTGDYPMYVLRRYDTFEWTLNVMALKDGPYMDINLTTTMLTPQGKGTWIPTMTSNVAPSGAAAASSEVSNHEAWRAFDDDVDSYWEGKTSQEGWLEYAFETTYNNDLVQFTAATTSGMTASAQSTDTGFDAWEAADRALETDWRSNNTLPQYWQIDLGAAHLVEAYQIRASKNKREFAPRDFTLQAASAVGGPYTVVDTRTDLTWESGQKRHFTVTGSISRRYWRIVVTKVNRRTITTIIPAVGKKGKRGYIPRRTVTTKTDNRAGFSEVQMSYVNGKPRIVDGYTIYLGRYNKGKAVIKHAPRTWYFEGWDGDAWRLLDSQQDYTKWNNFRSQYFKLQNDEPYKKYRIRIKTCYQEGDVNPRIGKLVMSSPDSPVITLRATSKVGINDGEGFHTTDVGRLIRLKDADNVWRWAYIGAVLDETKIELDLYSDDPLVLNKFVKQWRLGLWSDTTGWPICGVIHEDRLWCAGPSGFPDHIVGSRVGKHTNFVQVDAEDIVTDDMAIVTRCNSKYMSRIAWLKSSEEALMIGTGIQEFILTTPVDEALSARNFKIRPTTKRGSASHEPSTVDNHILMIQKAGRALYDYSWQPGSEAHAGSYSAPLLSTLGQHLLYPPLVQVVFQQEPHSILWGRRSDGSVVAMTYNPENGLYGGHRHNFNGEVEWLSVSPSPTDRQDSLWMIIKRTINGEETRTIERLYRFWDFGDILTEDATFMDASLRYLGEGETSYVYGLTHLEGKLVSVLADRIPYQNVGPVSNGKLTLVRPATDVVVGLPYVIEGEIAAPDSGAADGTAMGKSKRPHSVVLKLWESANGEVGRYNADTGLNEWTPVEYSLPLSANVPEVELKTTDSKTTVLPMGYDTIGAVRFRQTDPLPFNVVGVYPQLVTSDER